MGVKIIIHIRHIRGHSFDVEVDRDADCIGLKVAIWDSQQIALEGQRLVYNGKEVADESHLVDLGIDDGSTVFLVERIDNAPLEPVPSQDVQPVVAVPEESVSISAVEPMSVNSQYQQLSLDPRSSERVQAAVDLAFWVRIYCVFGIIVSLLALGRCWGPVIPLVCFVIGNCACRKLSRCCLVFPLLVAIMIGPVGFVFIIWKMATHFRAPFIAALFVSLLHFMIAASIMKLRCQIKHLSNEEKRTAVEKIRGTIRCFCC